MNPSHVNCPRCAFRVPVVGKLGSTLYECPQCKLGPFGALPSSAVPGVDNFTDDRDRDLVLYVVPQGSCDGSGVIKLRGRRAGRRGRARRRCP